MQVWKHQRFAATGTCLSPQLCHIGVLLGSAIFKGGLSVAAVFGDEAMAAELTSFWKWNFSPQPRSRCRLLFEVGWCLLRQLLAGLLAHHVVGVPVGPVWICVAETLLMLAVGILRTAKRACQIVCRGEGCLGEVDAAGETGRDLLQQPYVAVGVAESSEGTVAGVIRCGAGDLAGAVGLELSARRAGVERLRSRWHRGG